jgi:hypothetical protein
MGWIADHGLIEIAYLYLDLAYSVRDRAEISKVAIAADPYGRSLGKRSLLMPLKPFIEFDGVSTNIGMRRTRHLEVSSPDQGFSASIRTHKSFMDLRHLLPRACRQDDTRGGG